MRLTKLDMIKYLGLIFVFNITYSQKEISTSKDSLENKSYDYLENKFLENQADKHLASIYAKTYLKKAKDQEHKIGVLRAYYFLSNIDDSEESISYADSIILKSNTSGTDEYLPISYLRKGNIYYDHGNYQNALKSYLGAEKTLNIRNNPSLYFTITHNIGLIKNLIGQKKEALDIYRSYINYTKNNPDEKDLDNYLVALFSLSNCYIENRKLDSASIYNAIGTTVSLENKEMYFHYPKFLLNEGINLFYKKEFNLANDSLTKSIPLLLENNDSLNLAFALLYKSKVLKVNNDTLKYTNYLKSADSIISKKNKILPDFIEIYELLNNHYKKTNDLKNQLIYLEKMIVYNKSIDLRFANVYETITSEYDTPKLIKEKEILIKQLRHNDNKKSKQVSYLIILLVSVSSLTGYFYYKRTQYKKRFKAILKNGFLEKEADHKKVKKKLSIPQNIVSEIQVKLENFEQENQFLDRSVSLNKLAIVFGTNSNYLSKIINHHKKQNFNSYLNQLRIQYVIQKLKEDTQFRKYDIKSPFPKHFINKQVFIRRIL